MGKTDQPPQDDSEMYDLVPDLPPPSIARPPATLNYRALQDDRPDPSDTDTIKNLQAPFGLLVGGIVVNVGVALFLRRGTLADATVAICRDLLLNTALLLTGILVAARLRGIKLRPFPATLLKLAAICIAPSAVGALVGPLLMMAPIIGWLTLLAIEFSLYFALLGYFFDLDQGDTWSFVIVIFIVQIAIYFAWEWWREYAGR